MADHSELELSTPRLRLRAPRASDAEAIFAVYADTAVCRYLTWSAWTSVDIAHERLRKYRTEIAAGESVLLLIVRKSDGAMLGDCTLFDLDVQSRRAEVGYSLAASAWGQGFIQETVGELLRFGFEALDLHRIEADIDPRNTASARSLERLGFVREGLRRERWIVEGEVSDSEMFGLLRREWAAGRGKTG
jgi:RimJ/RimL family protein N-acetyltransferase